MIIKPNVIEAVNSLISAKQRSILALIGIVVGIGSVIAMVSVGSIVQQEALRQFMEMGTDVVSISKSFSGGGGRDPKLSFETALQIPGRCSSIRGVAPYASVYAQFKFQGQKASVPALGITPSFLSINKLHIKSGRFLHELDQNMFYCVIGKKVAGMLAAQGVSDPLGIRIFFKEKHLTVIGVIKEAPMGGMRPYEVNEGIMMPYTTLRRIDREGASINTIIARSVGGASQPRIQSEVSTFLESQNSAAVDVRTAEELIAQMQKQMRLFTLLLGTIGSISLIVGGIGVMNVMLVSVTERTKEIGIRRALGARQGDILFQFLVESVLLCIVGGLMGIAMGVGASWIISYYAKWQFAVSYESVGLGVAVAVAVGVFFGIYPARQAARLSPILALRSD